MIRTGAAQFIPNLILRLLEAEEANRLALDAECDELSAVDKAQNQYSLGGLNAEEDKGLSSRHHRGV